MASKTAVAIRGLTKHFGAVKAVDGLELDVAKGEVLGLVGPNGAGKTTTIRILAGLTRPTAGEVHVHGKRVRPEDRTSRRLVGVCPQENVLYPEMTARENLEYLAALYGVDRRTRRKRAEAVLAGLELGEKADVRASRLSGGMRRRLTLAGALMHDPPVLVLDEPEAGLDPQTRLLVRRVIRKLKGTRTIVLTSHNMDEVDRLADRVAFVDHGRLVALGTPAALKAQLGDGDTLEITVTNGHAPQAAAALQEAGLGTVRARDHTITVRGLGLPRRFPEILAHVQAAGAALEDVRFRGNTLEDAFIALTGRGLRE